MRSASKQEILDLSKKSTVTDQSGKRIYPYHLAGVPDKPAGPKSDIAQAMELIASAISDTQKTAGTQLQGQSQLVVQMLQQNKDLLESVRNELHPKQKPLEEWKFKFERNDGMIVSATATQLK